MRITVRVYAALKEATGRGLFELDVPEGAVVSEVLDSVVAEHPASGPFRNVMRGAIDDEYVAEDAPVPSGTELHIITPVSGG